MFREGLTRILGIQPRFNVVGDCSAVPECVEMIRKFNPDIVILDTDIQDYSFVEALAGIKHISPHSRVIILTHSEEDEDLFTAFKFGASAYITKDVKCEDLINDILRVHEGEVIIGAPVAHRMLKEFASLESIKDTVLKDSRYGLSQRENEILALVAKGAKNKEIASELYISENTVKVHISKILEKLQVHNRQQAAILAIEKGFVPR